MDRYKKHAKELIKNTVILAIGKFLPTLGALIVVPILTGYLTQEEYGTYDLVIVLVTFLLPVATLQIQTAAFRFLIDVRDDFEEVQKIITAIFVFTVLSSGIVLIIGYFFLPGDNITRLLIIGYFLLDILANTARQCARGLGKNKEYTISAVTSSLSKVLLVLVFVKFYKFGLKGAFISLTLSCCVSFFMIVITTRLYSYLSFQLFSWSRVKDLLNYSWAMVPNSVSMEVMRLSDRLVVTAFMGLSANAIYAVANKIPNILTIAQTTFTMAWQENASIASKDHDAGAYYSSMFRTMYDFMAGSLGLLICATPILFKILIRGDYGEAYDLMPLLFLASFLYSMCAYLGGIYVAYKDTKSVGMTTIAAAACNLIVDLSLIKWIGLYAASGSTFVSYLFLFIYRVIDVRKLVQITYEYRHMILVAALMVIESVLCFFNTPVTNIINLIFGITVFSILNRKLIKAVWMKFLSMPRKKAG